MGKYVKVYLTDEEVELAERLRDKRREDDVEGAAINAIMKQGLALLLTQEGIVKTSVRRRRV